MPHSPLAKKEHSDEGCKSMPKAHQETSIATSQKRFSVLAHAGFVIVGVVNTFLGAMLPTLSTQWRLNDAQAGRLFAAQFSGAMIGSLLSSLLLKRFGYLRTLVAGYTGMSVAIACLGLGTAGSAIVSIFFTGMFFGITIPTTNVLVSEMHPARRAAALNLVNFAWGIGAIAGPPAIVFFSQNGVLLPMLILASVLILVALSLSRCACFTPSESNSTIGRSESSALQAWMTPYAISTGLLIFLYVGTEASSYGWVATYAKRLAAPTQTLWMFAQSIFWAGLLSSRALAPLILRRLSAHKLIVAGLLTATAGLLLVLMGRELAGVTIGVALAGFGLGPVFPTTFALFSQRFGSLVAQMAGVVFVIGNLAAAAFPWAVGLLSDWYGGLRPGFMVPVAGAILMIVLQTAIVAYPRLGWAAKKS